MSTLVDNPWDLFPEHKHLGTEECGNEVIVDRTGGADGPVYGLWHDPPMIVVLARSAEEFLAIEPQFRQQGTYPVGKAIQDLVALTAGDSLTLERALAELEPPLAPWFQSFPAGATFVDLRAASPGSGFDFDAHSSFAKHPDMAVFAVYTPPRKPGLFSRLIGRA